MSIIHALQQELDQEKETTRRVLERVPGDRLSWKPHDKSMSLGELAGHIANLPMWCSATLQNTTLDLDAYSNDTRPRQPESQSALLKEFDAKVKAARALLAERSDPELLAAWTLKKAGQEIFTMPRISAIRSFVMNHLIHHRGQLSVYLRLKNVPIPPIYGPTADEQ